MLLLHITSYPSQWPVQLPGMAIATGRGMYVGENTSGLFNDKKYWPGIWHQ